MIENPYMRPELEDRIRQLGDAQTIEKYLDPDPLGLTLIQRLAFPAVRWLLFGQRSSGRSFLMAHIFIQQAIRFPGNWLAVFDVSQYASECQFRNRATFRRVLDACAGSYPEYKFSIRTTGPLDVIMMEDL